MFNLFQNNAVIIPFRYMQHLNAVCSNDFIVLTKLIAEISEHNYVADNKRT